MKVFYLSLFLIACTTHRPVVAPKTPERAVTLTIHLIHDSIDERATEQQLRRLSSSYDLRPWLYTTSVNVDENAIPHSHPVLTLHTRHVRDDLLLLSTFIHEESHWYLEEHPTEVAAAVDDLRAIAPALPVGFPDGADSERSTYEHLIVIALEERGIQRLAGELAAHDVMEFWARDHYRALYRFVVDRRSEVRAIMRKHGLASPGEHGG